MEMGSYCRTGVDLKLLKCSVDGYPRTGNGLDGHKNIRKVRCVIQAASNIVRAQNSSLLAPRGVCGNNGSRSSIELSQMSDQKLCWDGLAP